MKYNRQMYCGKTMGMDEIIGFWRQTEKHGYMSQWYKSPMIIDGVEYTCCEQYMMAEKARLFNDLSILDEILQCTEPKRMKELGRAVKGFDTCKWEEHKYNIVFKGNLNKFTQNKKLAEKLLETGDTLLVEASPYDRVWGIGMGVSNASFRQPSKWRGSNLLGFAIMEVRDTIKEQTV